MKEAPLRECDLLRDCSGDTVCDMHRSLGPLSPVPEAKPAERLAED